MKNKAILLSIAIFSSILAIAQPDFEKVSSKADKYISKNKYEKAEDVLTTALDEAPYWGEGWDKLSKIKLWQWELAKRNKNNSLSFTISSEGPDGEQLKNDSLTQVFAQLLGKVNPANMAYEEALNTMKWALINCNTAYMTSIYLRSYSVDAYPDTAIADEAMKYFFEAEGEFQKKNFRQAAQLYQKALDIEPKFYKASLYLGDSYYALEYYAQAIDKFKASIGLFPNELEPRKYLTDAYANSGLYDKALIAACEAIAVYPDLTMLGKLENIARYNDKTLLLHWTPRKVLPNRVSRKSERYDLNGEIINVDAPWRFYVSAYDNVKDNCNANGLIEYSDVTKTRYLEIYSWEQMLENSNDPSLDEAREMQKKGYLDCYVFVNCFHQDFYEQYQDFVANNPGRVEAYLKNQMK